MAELMKVDVHKMVDTFGFYRIKIPKGKVSTEHYHEQFVELFYLLTPIRMTINDQEHQLPTGTLVVLHPNDKHEEFADDADVEYLAMKFPYVEGDKIVTKT